MALFTLATCTIILDPLYFTYFQNYKRNTWRLTLLVQLNVFSTSARILLKFSRYVHVYQKLDLNSRSNITTETTVRHTFVIHSSYKYRYFGFSNYDWTTPPFEKHSAHEFKNWSGSDFSPLQLFPWWRTNVYKLLYFNWLFALLNIGTLKLPFWRLVKEGFTRW